MSASLVRLSFSETSHPDDVGQIVLEFGGLFVGVLFVPYLAGPAQYHSIVAHGIPIGDSFDPMISSIVTEVHRFPSGENNSTGMS